MCICAHTLVMTFRAFSLSPAFFRLKNATRNQNNQSLKKKKKLLRWQILFKHDFSRGSLNRFNC